MLVFSSCSQLPAERGWVPPSQPQAKHQVIVKKDPRTQSIISKTVVDTPAQRVPVKPKVTAVKVERVVSSPQVKNTGKPQISSRSEGVMKPRPDTFQTLSPLNAILPSGVSSKVPENDKAATPYALVYLPYDIWDKSVKEPLNSRYLTTRIKNIVTASKLDKKGWKEFKQGKVSTYYTGKKGLASTAYLNGIALTYARAYMRLKAEEDLAILTAQKERDTTADALHLYRADFNKLGINVKEHGATPLRATYTLLAGLGQARSGGIYNAGHPVRKGTPQKEQEAEAGLFRNSEELIYSHLALRDYIPLLEEQYLKAPEQGLLNVFHPRNTDKCRWKNVDHPLYGSSYGRRFQELSRFSPAFAVESTALALRYSAQEYPVLARRRVEIHPEFYQLLIEVEAIVDSSPWKEQKELLLEPKKFKPVIIE